ncbi:phage terminase small subunit [Methanococcus maripaludis]|uniref:Phage terminase small subunit n=1 Tax=Methanococcus maripaludis TaxID=39152 RepID=A0A7J9P6G4_METMI|nr:terminase small subunit [Methanococcus maripaludis]MBA2858307.1 phage terminase small subunit [Methanococcus maripaludis]
MVNPSITDPDYAKYLEELGKQQDCQFCSNFRDDPKKGMTCKKWAQLESQNLSPLEVMSGSIICGLYKESELKENQKRFCERYLVHGNLARAATEAGYSEKRARQQGSDLFKLPYIQAHMKYLRHVRVDEECKMDMNFIRKQLKEIIEGKTGFKKTYTKEIPFMRIDDRGGVSVDHMEEYYTEDIPTSDRDRIAAMALVCKLEGYTDKIDDKPVENPAIIELLAQQGADKSSFRAGKT